MSVAGVMAEVFIVFVVAVLGQKPLVCRAILFVRAIVKCWTWPTSHRGLCHSVTLSTNHVAFNPSGAFPLQPLPTRHCDPHCIKMLQYHPRLIPLHLVGHHHVSFQITWSHLPFICHFCPHRLQYLKLHLSVESLNRVQPAGYFSICILKLSLGGSITLPSHLAIVEIFFQGTGSPFLGICGGYSLGFCCCEGCYYGLHTFVDKTSLKI